jgi:hypothetical protein
MSGIFFSSPDTHKMSSQRSHIAPIIDSTYDRLSNKDTE